MIRFDNATDQSEVVAATTPFERLIGPRGPASRGLSGLVRQTRQGRIFTREEVLAHGYSPILREAQVRSALVVPLISRQTLIGTLSLVRHATATADFTAEDLQLMEVFAGRAAVAIDNAELVKDLQHKNKLLELLVEEAHHRIKNNLQMVSGLLQLQAETGASGDVSAQLRSATTRVQAIAKVHNLLSQDMPEKVDAEKLIAALVHTLVDVSGTEGAGPRVELDLEQLWLTSEQAVAVALIVNELVSNALLHARVPAGERLHLRISCRRENGQARLQIADNGGGFPTGFNWRNSRGQGLNIIIQLAQVNLRGALEIASRDGGVFAGVRFELAQAEQPADHFAAAGL
jgi:two-component sensor histidine kinase